jgi:RHS repeat-associated protein
LSTGEVNRFFDDGEQHNGAARYLTRDHLGSVREVTDAAGAVVTRDDYDPYGRLTRVVGTEDSRFGYTGHFLHAASGLTLPLYRAYDAGIGRWLSEDPLGFVDGPNAHAYVGNNPVVRIDRFGLQYDSVTRSLQEAIRRGNVAEIRNILEVSKDVLSAEWKTAGQEAITKLQTPARD